MPIRDPAPGHDKMCGRRIWPNRVECGCEQRAAVAAQPKYTPPLPHACCDLAIPIACVCAFAYTCPVHGVKHIGSHE